MQLLARDSENLPQLRCNTHKARTLRGLRAGGGWRRGRPWRGPPGPRRGHPCWCGCGRRRHGCSSWCRRRIHTGIVRTLPTDPPLPLSRCCSWSGAHSIGLICSLRPAGCTASCYDRPSCALQLSLLHLLARKTKRRLQSHVHASYVHSCVLCTCCVCFWQLTMYGTDICAYVQPNYCTLGPFTTSLSSA